MFNMIGGLILVSHAPQRCYSAGGFWGCDRLVSEPLVIENLDLIWGKRFLLKPDYNQNSALNDPQRHFAPRARLDILGNKSHVTSANLDNIQAIQRLAHRITDQAVDQNRLPKRVNATATVTTSATPATPSDSKRKWDGDSSKGSASVQSQAQQQKTDHYQSPRQQFSGGYRQRRYQGFHPKCHNCNRHHSGQCNKGRCQRCLKMGHEAKDCRSPRPANQNQQPQLPAPQNQQQ
ncbi:putative transcription factor interactor and regulator CCHC(Zn) family [Helianthus anomalus]